MVIARLFHYIKQDDMRAFSKKIETFVVMPFWPVQLDSLSLCDFSE